MTNTEIKPQAITKPIQLLAAWLSGLVLVNGSFLTAATTISSPVWLPILLVVASVINVPIFLLCIFLLQTKFRPEMQEDTYYSQYLEKKYNNSTTTTKSLNLESHFEKLTNELLSKVEGVTDTQVTAVTEIVKESENEILLEKVKESRTLSELYMHPSSWSELVDEFDGDISFNNDLNMLLTLGLAYKPEKSIYKVKLTLTGERLAKQLQDTNMLWHQIHDEKGSKKGSN